jgi:hypothetical protein
MSNAINQMNNETEYTTIARKVSAMTNAELVARASAIIAMFAQKEKNEMLTLEFDIIMDEKSRRQSGVVAQLTREAAAMTNAELFARANELNKLFDRMDNDQMLSLEFDIIMDEKIRRQFGK